MLAGKLLDTPLIVLPGMSEAEINAEWELHCQRSRMTDQFLHGEIDPEVFFDFMAEQDYDAEELLDQAEENLEFAIREGLLIEK